MSRPNLSPKIIEQYLDNTLSEAKRKTFEQRIQTDTTLAGQVQEARQLRQAIGPTMKSALGQPLPPPDLQAKIRAKVQRQARKKRLFSLAGFPMGPFLNAVGTMTIIIVVGLGAYLVVQNQPVSETTTPGSVDLTQISDSPALSLNVETATPTAATNQEAAEASEPLVAATATMTLAANDALPAEESPVSAAVADSTPLPTPTPVPSPTADNAEIGTSPETTAPELASALTETEPSEGLIAFSFFNAAPQRRLYEIHLIAPDGSNHTRFPVDGVSEPTLRTTETGHALAYRTWDNETTSRSLWQGDVDGRPTHQISHFWEDAQPDWSPTTDWLIYASQRETDRRWRLYTVNAAGTEERDLRIAGKAPSFAPDGNRFVYEGCDPFGNRCGLWTGALDSSSQTSLVEDAAAFAPDWSPTGDQIAFMALTDDNWDLYLADASDGKVRRLTTAATIEGLPTWSPDGEWLAYLSNREGNWGIWRLHVTTGEAVLVFAFDGGIFTPPHGDPYGERDWWDEQISWSE